MTAPIAILGIGCRVAGARSAAELARLLAEGIDAVRVRPPQRFAGDPSFGGWLDDVAGFDAGFFGISPREAAVMDPQQRLALEVGWEALEDARIVPSHLRGRRVGVFLGMHGNEYERMLWQAGVHDPHATVGTSRAGAAGRLAHVLGVVGPALVVDSDRSSSLVAVHLACQSLRAGDCELALVGGVNLVLSPDLGIAFARAGMLAADGRCKFGDARADGFVRSDGVGFVVLAATGDNASTVRAVIRGTAVNHNGAVDVDLTAPCQAAQEALIRQALADAGVPATRVAVVEAHGTGTALGDRVELAAIGRVLGAGRAPGAALPVGSLKSNIGHTEAAAGILGLIKATLSLEQRRVFPSLHVTTPNPAIPFDALGVRIATELAPLPEDPEPCASVSSFGLVGTNAHVVLQAAPARALTAFVEDRAAHVLCLSARTDAALAALAARYAAHLADPAIALGATCHTAVTAREQFACRRGFAARTREDLIAELEDHARDAYPAPPVIGGKRVFVFPGQGSQWLGMGKDLLATEPVFRATLARADVVVRREAGWSVLDELAAGPERSRLSELEVVQPVLVAIGAALADLWSAWGLVPDAVVGTSMGEATAAYAAGVLSLDDALAIICRRTRLMKRMAGLGAMAVVDLDVDAAERALADHAHAVSIAACNSPRSTVISGSREAIAEIVARVKANGRFAEPIKVDVASHSPQMEPLLDELSAALAGIAPRAGRVPLYSTVTGTRIDGRTMSAPYWARNLRQPVQLARAMAALIADEHRVFVEISPHPVLCPSLGECANDVPVVVAPSLRRDEPGALALRRAVAALYGAGCRFAWEVIEPAEHAVAVPCYPWQHERAWIPEDGVVRAAAPIAAPASAPATTTARAQTLSARLAVASSAERRDLVSTLISHEINRALGRPRTTRVDPQVPFRDLGLKSLMVVEVRNALAAALDRDLPATLLFNWPTLDELTEHLVHDHGEMPLLGNLLTTSGSLGPAQLDEALGEQARTGERLGSILIKRGYITSEALSRALAWQLSQPVAIVGMACRFPGAGTLDAFWDLLQTGTDAITEIPQSRWSLARFHDPDRGASGKHVGRWGGFVRDVDMFDAAFFGIAPREAEEMDPQQRLMLEVTWEALEHAGQAGAGLAGSRTGVFFGLMNYNDYTAVKQLHLDPARIDAHHGTNTATSVAAGRIAYSFGLQGPAMAIDTACSSSLVAIHLACQSLRRGESTMALAGGVNLLLSPEFSIAFSKAGMLASDGRCRTFDAAASGYVRSEGCGVLVLKNLHDALRDRDRIHALILGTAVNQDGRSSGLTAPNGRAQEQVIRDALTDANLEPDRVGYVEAHGTGTPLGDPIELRALGSVFAGRAGDAPPLVVGSVKTNIGHLEAAAGVAGLIKVALGLAHAQIPPHLHLRSLNPAIGDLSRLGIEIPTAARPWPHARKVAGVSSFGFSGTNAHVVVEAAPAGTTRTEAPTRTDHVLTLSARTDAALLELAVAFDRQCAERGTLADVCFSASTGRAHFDTRLAVTARDAGDVRAALSAYVAGGTHERLHVGRPIVTRPRIALLFTGQGAQYAGMARGLYDAEPAFRRTLAHAEQVVSDLLERPLLEVMFGDDGAIHETRYTQPALLALEYAVASLLQDWGLEPACLVGHSIGEIAAACVAGVLPFEAGLRFAAHRGALMQALPRDGAMAALTCDHDAAAALIADIAALSIAAINAPDSVVISGHRTAVDEVLARCAARAIRTSRLDVSHAFHSPLLDPMLDALAVHADALPHGTARLPIVSNLTGAVASAGTYRADYWVRHARDPVRFADGIAEALRLGCDTFVEVGPHATLLGLAQRCTSEPELAWLPSLRRGRADGAQLAATLAALYVRGATLDWPRIHEHHPASRVPLPTYPFQRKRFWVAGERAPARSQEGAPRLHPYVHRRVELAGTQDVVFESTLDLMDPAWRWIAGHIVHGTVIVPAVALAEIALAAGALALGQPCTQHDHQIVQALPVDGVLALQIVVRPAVAGAVTCEVHARRAGAAFALHARSRLVAVTAPIAARALDRAALAQHLGPVQDGEAWYAEAARRGLGFGPELRSIRAVQVHRHADGRIEALARVEVPAGLEVGARPHPVVIDAALQIAACARAGDAPDLPLGWRIARIAEHGAPAWCYVEIRPREAIETSAYLVTDDGTVVAVIEGLTQARISAATLSVAAGAATSGRYALGWHASPEPRSAPGDIGRRTWLVLGDRGALADEITRLLEARGVPCQRIAPVDAGERAFEALADQLQRLAADELAGVLVLCGLEVATIDEPSGAVVQADMVRTTGATIVALQHLLGRHRTPRHGVWVVTRAALAVAGAAPRHPAAAGLWGLGRVVELEHPELWGGAIDLDITPGPLEASQIVRELLSNRHEGQVALRDGQRLVARIESVPAAAHAAPLVCDPGASYLVTGGLGALGLATAAWLADHGARTIYLCARTAPSAAARAACERLTVRGVAIVVARCDVAERDQVSALLATIARGPHPLRGVIHAAGIVEDAVIANLSRARLERGLAAKVAGAWNLHELTRALDLELFAMYSSLTSVVGTAGQAVYAAANAFLDALAHVRRAAGLPAVAINWGPVGDAGMAAALGEAGRRAFAARGIPMVDTATLLAQLGTLIIGPHAQLGFPEPDWVAWSRGGSARRRTLVERVVIGASTAASPGPGDRGALAMLPAAARFDVLLDLITRELVGILGFDGPEEAAPHASLTDLGLDSVMAVELRSKLAKHTGVSAPATLVLDQPSIFKLATYFSEQLTASAARTQEAP